MMHLSSWQIEKAIAEGKALEMCKYRYYGMYSAWKPVTAEVAAHKMQVQVIGYCGDDGDIEDWFCPYAFRLAEA